MLRHNFITKQTIQYLLIVPDLSQILKRSDSTQQILQNVYYSQSCHH